MNHHVLTGNGHYYWGSSTWDKLSPSLVLWDAAIVALPPLVVLLLRFPRALPSIAGSMGTSRDCMPESSGSTEAASLGASALGTSKVPLYADVCIATMTVAAGYKVHHVPGEPQRASCSEEKKVIWYGSHIYCHLNALQASHCAQAMCALSSSLSQRSSFLAMLRIRLVTMTGVHDQVQHHTLWGFLVQQHSIPSGTMNPTNSASRRAVTNRLMGLYNLSIVHFILNP
jgi:hypothetical protein